MTILSIYEHLLTAPEEPVANVKEWQEHEETHICGQRWDE